MFRKFKGPILGIFDIIISPVILLGALAMRIYRRKGILQFRVTTKLLDRIGIFPLVEHYYDPLIVPQKELNLPGLSERRQLAINFGIEEQLKLLREFNYQGELLELENQNLRGVPRFSYQNGAFESGDAEFYYSLLRNRKPKKIIEIGSGNSTIVALHAVAKNEAEDPCSTTEIICIEPYEKAWLEGAPNVHLYRKKVQEFPLDFFKRLKEGDILFIDSSHIIRPQGDVVHEFLHVIPHLNKGVLVHVHDIFTPYDYCANWIVNHRLFWNEQYLLEALLSKNDSLEVIASLNYLSHDHAEELAAAFPMYAKRTGCDLGSFWFRTK